MLKQNRNFTEAKSSLVSKAKKAMYALYTRIKSLKLPIDCQLLLFDKTIAPIYCMVVKFGASRIRHVSKKST